MELTGRRPNHKSSYFWGLVRFYVTKQCFAFKKSLDGSIELAHEGAPTRRVPLSKPLLKSLLAEAFLFTIDSDRNMGFFSLAGEVFTDQLDDQADDCVSLSRDRVIAWDCQRGKIYLIDCACRRMLHTFWTDSAIRGLWASPERVVVVTLQSTTVLAVEYGRTYLHPLKSGFAGFPGRRRLVVAAWGATLIVTDGYLIKTFSEVDEEGSAWTNHYRAATKICLLNSGGRFALGFKDGLIQIYDLDLTPRFIFAAHFDEITCLYIREACLVSGSLDGRMKLWCLETYQLSQQFAIGAGIVDCDSSCEGILCPREFVMWRFSHLHDLRATSLCRLSQIKQIRCPGHNNLIGLTLDGSVLKVLNERDLSQVATHSSPRPILDYSYSHGDPGSPTIAVVDHFGHLTLTHDPRPPLVCETNCTCTVPFEVGTGSFIACGRGDGVICLVDCAGWGPVSRTSSHEGQPVRSLATAGRVLISSGDDKSLRLWAVAGPALLNTHSIFCETSPTSLAVVSPHTCAVICGEDSSTFLLDLQTKSKIVSSYNESLSGRVLCASACRGLGIYATLTCDGLITVWNSDNEVVRKLAIRQRVDGLCFGNGVGDMLLSFSNSLWVIRGAYYLPRHYLRKLTTKREHRRPGVPPGEQHRDITVVQLSPPESPPLRDETLLREYSRLITRQEDIRDITRGLTKRVRPAPKIRPKLPRALTKVSVHGARPPRTPKLTVPEPATARRTPSDQPGADSLWEEDRVSLDEELEENPIFIEIGSEENECPSEVDCGVGGLGESFEAIGEKGGVSIIDVGVTGGESPRGGVTRESTPGDGPGVTTREPLETIGPERNVPFDVETKGEEVSPTEVSSSSLIIVCECPTVETDPSGPSNPESVFVTESPHCPDLQIEFVPESYSTKEWFQKFAKKPRKSLDDLVDEAKLFRSSDLADIIDIAIDNASRIDFDKIRKLILSSLWLHDLNNSSLLATKLFSLISKVQAKDVEVVSEVLKLHSSGGNHLRGQVMGLLTELGFWGCDLGFLEATTKKGIAEFIERHVDKLAESSDDVRQEILGTRRRVTAIDALNCALGLAAEGRGGSIKAVILSSKRDREPVLTRYGESYTQHCSAVVPYGKVRGKGREIPSIYYPMRKCDLLPFTENLFLSSDPEWLKKHFDIQESIDY